MRWSASTANGATPRMSSRNSNNGMRLRTFSQKTSWPRRCSSISSFWLRPGWSLQVFPSGSLLVAAADQTVALPVVEHRRRRRSSCPPDCSSAVSSLPLRADLSSHLSVTSGRASGAETVGTNPASDVFGYPGLKFE